MKTYQDFLNVGSNESSRMEFIDTAISEHKGTRLYQNALVAEAYFKGQNKTIHDYVKLLYTITGKAVVDNYSANWKMPSKFFGIFTMQQVQFLLGNGVSWSNQDTNDILGDKRNDFSYELQKAAKYALIGGVSFGFFNLNHLEVFKVTEFAPLYDENNGALMAGIRFWQVSSDKPMRATFYEMDGYTDYIWNDGKGSVLKEKRPYIVKYRESIMDGTEIYDFENYPTFPIVPFWGSQTHQSKLVGLREQIDCYDLIKSGFANDIDDASLIYWTIQNAGGMDDVDLVKFVERMHTIKAAVVEQNGASAEAHSLDVPYASREALLDRIEKDLYRDAMALDPRQISSGAVSIVQIKASYEPLNSLCDDFEYCVLDFIYDILDIAGIEDETPTFTRSMIANNEEMLNMVLQAAEYLPEDYITRKVLTILGDGDMADEILDQINADELSKVRVEDEVDNVSENADDSIDGIETEIAEPEEEPEELEEEVDDFSEV